MGGERLLAEYVNNKIVYAGMTETEYVNMVNDFCFHVIWASKKYFVVNCGLQKNVAEIRNFNYPENAVDYAKYLVTEYFGDEL